MKKRYPNHRLVKKHRNYTVEEASDLLGMHKNTVRRWIKEGLPLVDVKRPVLILGSDLIEFLKRRRASRKQQCKAGEIFCVRCRAPKHPAGDMADYTAETEKIGTLTAICPDCDGIMFRRTSNRSLSGICQILDVSLTMAERHIIESGQPIVNSYFKEV